MESEGKMRQMGGLGFGLRKKKEGKGLVTM